MRDKNHWTAEEYREFQRTGREPIRATKPAERKNELEQKARDIMRETMRKMDEGRAELIRETMRKMDDEERAEIERKWAEAEKRGEIMTLNIPAETEAPKKHPKYGNKAYYVGEIRFQSKHEGRVYEALMARVESGELRCVCRQVGFDLPGNIRYFADFVAIRPDNTIEVIDAKSEITKKNRVYINKKKQLKAIWGIDIVEM